ncbi:hypothetical protein VCRA2110O2_30334 [Vibrio crassostreae]|nr:hypothetical protein VCHA44O286_50044 [Vibrio chagasii]CAK2874911.1 hypothetical protein VCRA2110O2_30334 [Vibrio crassostreae]
MINGISEEKILHHLQNVAIQNGNSLEEAFEWATVMIEAYQSENTAKPIKDILEALIELEFSPDEKLAKLDDLLERNVAPLSKLLPEGKRKAFLVRSYKTIFKVKMKQASLKTVFIFKKLLLM